MPTVNRQTSAARRGLGSRAPLILWLVAAAVSACTPCLVADELLFSYDADVFPFDDSGGFEIYARCDYQCVERLDAGHFIIEWLSLGGDMVNYNHFIADVSEVPPQTLWIEWRFRSNQVFLPTEPGCDGRLAVQYRSIADVVNLYGDGAMSFSGSDAHLGLEVDEFYTVRFESVDGVAYTFAIDGTVFTVDTGHASDIGHLVQFGGSGDCARPTGVVIRNEWDFIRYGTISDGEAIVATDPPAGVVDAVVHPDIYRFTITFDQPGYV